MFGFKLTIQQGRMTNLGIFPKIIVLALFLLVLPYTLHTAEPPKTTDKSNSFLFIGNSFTFRHELKDIFKTLAMEGNPGTNFIAERITYGGRDMFRHYDMFRSQDLLCLGSLTDAKLRESIDEMRKMAQPMPELPFYAGYWKSIDARALVEYENYEAKDNGVRTARARTANRKSTSWEEDQKLITNSAIKHHQTWINNRSDYPAAWNYVVLQSWQDVSENPETGYIKYATLFAKAAKRQNTTPILYLTAPYSLNKESVKEPMEPERALKETRIAADIAKKTGAIVVPVPLAIYRLQKAGIPIVLGYKNDIHPNQTCAYLTACLFYAAVFNKSPEGLALSEVAETKIVDADKPGCDPDGNPLKRVFTEAERKLLQRTAWETMEAFRRGEF